MRNEKGQFNSEPRPEKRKRVTLACPICSKIFEVGEYRLKSGIIICCSRSCGTTKSKTGWERPPISDETKKKIASTLKEFYKNPEDTPKWKGDNVGYFGIHDWLTKHYGQPIGCEVCGLDDPNRQYYWANLSGAYTRDRFDFKRMCPPCHKKYDNKMKKIRENEPAQVIL